jgi:hypothetical protein
MATTEDIKNDGTRADSLTANGHDFGSGGTRYDGTGPDALANYISGPQWADELGEDPEALVADVLGGDTWKALRKFCRRFDIAVEYGDGGMAFADFDAVPRSIWHHTAEPAVSITRREAAVFAADTLAQDAHVIGGAWELARQKRFTEQRAVEQALDDVSVPVNRAYTLAEVERVCGADTAAQVRDVIDQHNADTWNTPKPHNHFARLPLITAGELHGQHGVTVALLAAMDAASAAEVSAAKEALSVAQKRHVDDIVRQARGADLAPLALDAGVLSFAQLSQLEPVTPLIDGLLAKGELAELIGEPGTAKTFIALGMALSIAAGRDWCGHQVPRPASTLYVLAEGASDIEVRAKAFCERHKITTAELGDRFHLFPRPVQITDERHISEVRAYATKHGIDAVVFDTKARCTVGVEENSATDQGRAIANVETVNEECGAAVLLVHHTAKGSDTARGSTAWLGAVWSSLLVTRPTKDKKKTSAVSITCVKHKGWPDGCTHKFTLADITVTEDAMPGKTPTQRQSLAVVPVDAVAEAVAQAKDDSEIGIKIKAVFHTYGATTGLTKAEARKHARDEGVKDSSFSRYFDNFAKAKVLVPMPGASAHYRLTTDAAASTVGTEENQALVDALKDRMCELSATGEITAAHTRTDVANMLGAPDKTAFSQAWGWFEDQGRPAART